MLSACCKAEIYYDAWVTADGELAVMFDFNVCSKCEKEKPEQLKEELAQNDN